MLGLPALAAMASCAPDSDAPAEMGSSAAAPAEAPAPAPEIPIGKVIDWEAEIDNPATDGWESEVAADAAKKQLQELGRLLGSGAAAHPGDLATLALDPQETLQLRPELVGVFDDGHTSVARLGAGGGVRAASFEPGSDAGFRSGFKVVRVERGDRSFTTEQLVEFAWQSPAAVVEQHATWVIQWNDQGDAPKISSLEVTAFEQTRTTIVGGGTLFSDCTAAALGANPSYREQLLHGLNHWHERMPHLSILNSMSTPGLAIGDVNGDGLDDFYLCQDPGLPNRLFIQEADGTMRDASVEWEADWLEDSRAALIVDLDNDGDRDLAVSILGHVIVASNQDHARFQLELVLPVSESTVSLSASDFDRDGRLDLYVCGYAPDISRNQLSPAAAGFGSDGFSYHDANNSVPNTFFRNETTPAAGLRCAEVTAGSGLDANNRRWSFAAAWEDYDNDGDPDLYVANDFGRNNLYRNDTIPGGGARFTDVAGPAGAEDGASGMSVSWSDYDRDGWMDIFISNMFSSAGSRIVPQPEFQPRISDDLRQRYQHFARGNTLLRNLGRGAGFGDTTVAAGVTMGRWAWGSLLADVNNDGWEDVIVANGNITADEDSGDL